MDNNFLKSEFAKKSRFHWDFIGNYKDSEKWEILSDNYNYSQFNQEKKTLRKRIDLRNLFNSIVEVL